MVRFFLSIVLLFFDCTVVMATDSFNAHRLQQLLLQLRCPKCQNESIYGSQSELSIELRAIVKEQMLAGKSDAEIKIFLVERYGDFILYQPRLKQSTMVLWGTPFILLGAFLYFFYRYYRRHVSF